MKVLSVVAALGVLWLAGCTVAATPSPVQSVAPSPSEVASIYPYSIPWPADELETKWLYASTAWDGESRIDHGNMYTDEVRTRDGYLFAFGLPISGTAADMQELVALQATEWHGCSREPSEEHPLAGGGEEGIFAVHDCGGETVLRWFAVHKGFGLFAALIVAPDADPQTAQAHFEHQIGELVWTD
ncbi:MAG TPA: hypothetical protein VF013_00910 [Candidatus Limnocylindria bacterium]